MLLVEVEGRQGIAQLFDVPPLPYAGGQDRHRRRRRYRSTRWPSTPRRRSSNTSTCSTTSAWLAGRCAASAPSSSRRRSRRACATCCSPARSSEIVTRAREGQAAGLRRHRGGLPADGPHRPIPRRHQGGVGPGQGRAGALAGRERGQGAALRPHRRSTWSRCWRRCRSRRRSRRSSELQELDLPIGSVIVNRNIPAYLSADDLAKAAEGDIDADAVRSGPDQGAESPCPTATLPVCSPRPIQHATRITARAESAEQLDELDVSRLELPQIPDGVDLGSLYELAEALAIRASDERQGRQMTRIRPLRSSR